MMSLRQVALEHNFSIPVSWLGKIKTALQMVCLTFIILNPAHAAGLWCAPRWNLTETVLIFVTLVLSLWSAYLYYQKFVEQYRAQVLSKYEPDHKDITE